MEITYYQLRFLHIRCYSLVILLFGLFLSRAYNKHRNLHYKMYSKFFPVTIRISKLLFVIFNQKKGALYLCTMEEFSKYFFEAKICEITKDHNDCSII